MSELPTSPNASEHPLEEPPKSDPQSAFLAQHTANFSALVGTMLDDKLRPVNQHIAAEDHDRGELLRILVELKVELGMLAAELKAGRLDNIALHAAINTLTDRVDKHGVRLDELERK